MIHLCPKCKSKNIWKRGFRYNKSGNKQKYHCKDCDNWFIEDDGFKRMRFKKEIIVKAIHQHIDGFSLFKIKYHLWQHEGVKVSRKTILLWERKYSAFLKSDKPESRANHKRQYSLR
jgi:transposase-like protein